MQLFLMGGRTEATSFESQFCTSIDKVSKRVSLDETLIDVW